MKWENVMLCKANVSHVRSVSCAVALSNHALMVRSEVCGSEGHPTVLKSCSANSP